MTCVAIILLGALASAAAEDSQDARECKIIYFRCGSMVMMYS